MHTAEAAAPGGDLSAHLTGVRHPPPGWAGDGTEAAGREVLSGLESTEGSRVEFCQNPRDWPPGLLGVLGIFPSGEAPPSGRGHRFRGVIFTGEGESQLCNKESVKDGNSTCLAGVRAAGGFPSLSGVQSGVCGVQGSLLGVALEEIGDFQELFLGVCKENVFQC